MEHIYMMLPKYFNKQSTVEENALIEDWKKENPELFKEHKAIWTLTKDVEYIDFDSKASWNELQPRLSKNTSSTKTKVVGSTLWQKIAVAAVVIIVVLLGINQFSNSNTAMERSLFADGLNTEFTTEKKGRELLATSNVVETVLKNGDKIWLNKGAVAEDMGSLLLELNLQ